jgi:hypothetical protein
MVDFGRDLKKVPAVRTLFLAQNARSSGYSLRRGKMIRFIGKPDQKPYNKKTRHADYYQSLKQQRNKIKHHGTHNQPQMRRFHTRDATFASIM